MWFIKLVSHRSWKFNLENCFSLIVFIKGPADITFGLNPSVWQMEIKVNKLSVFLCFWQRKIMRGFVGDKLCLAADCYCLEPQSWNKGEEAQPFVANPQTKCSLVRFVLSKASWRYKIFWMFWSYIWPSWGDLEKNSWMNKYNSPYIRGCS